MRSRRKAPERKKSRKKAKADQPAANFKTHPLYGKIPLVPTTYQDAAGHPHTIHMWDLDYQPSMPRGAVRGDVRKQNLCLACHVPKYFYVDQYKVCTQCGRDFVFAAAEQKFWYESLGFYGTSVPIRCPECRRRRRNESSLNQQVAVTKASLRKTPKDPALLLNLAEAIVLLHMRTGHGKLAEAITAARVARQIDPNAFEGMFWEGCCHMLAQRNGKAKALLQKFTGFPARSSQHATLLKRAAAYLEQLASSK